MDEPITHSSGTSPSDPQASRAASHNAKPSERLRVYLAGFLVLAAASTFAGFLVGHLQVSANGPKLPSRAAAPPAPALVADPEPRRRSAELAAISHLPPQQQAERLLELAAEQPDASLAMIRQNLNGWRGHLEETDRLFHLVLAALNSDDPRIRIAAVEIDLAACHLAKAHESITTLLRQIQGNTDDRFLALWRLGALGNRGVEPNTALATLRRYARDRNQQARFWAVLGLAMLGTRESIDTLLDSLAHDPAPQIRESAATGLAKSGLFTGEQRLTAVPQLLNLLDDDSLNEQTKNLVCTTLEAITGASFGKNTRQWREWWRHHDAPEKTHRRPRNLLTA